MRQIVICMLALLMTGEVCAGTKDARVDSLYREALAMVGQVPPKESIKAFEQVLKLDWNHARAHYQIAKLYMALNTPLTRQSARKALDEAMRLDPDNQDYQLTLGELLNRQRFTFNAERQYQKIAEVDSGNAEGAYWAGFFAVEEYLALIDKEGGIMDNCMIYKEFMDYPERNDM